MIDFPLPHGREQWGLRPTLAPALDLSRSHRPR
jgi:hypothetical protein